MNERADARAPDDAATPAPASPFTRFTDRDVVDLVAEYPLAWVCAGGADVAGASLLPLLATTEDDGRPATLVGHMARRNPLFAALRADPRCVALFTGPHAYISPELVADRQWAPTWNYAQLRIAGTLSFDTAGGPALAMLVAAMEEARPSPWQIAEMGPRYDAMERAIVGFRVRIDRIEGRFKLGQDERTDTVRQILSGLADPGLVRWMTRFNAARL